MCGDISFSSNDERGGERLNNELGFYGRLGVSEVIVERKCFIHPSKIVPYHTICYRSGKVCGEYTDGQNVTSSPTDICNCIIFRWQISFSIFSKKTRLL